MDVKQISEDFLHYIWKLQCLDLSSLQTADKQPLEIVSPGQHNQDAGPDFFNAKIKVGETLWVGNVEIHIKSSMWNDHKHQEDNAYNSVILHVVFDHNQEIQTKSGITIPVLSLKDRIDSNVFNSYLQLRNNADSIPCQHALQKISDFTIRSMISRSAIERMENKTTEIQRILDYVNGDWEACCFILIARYFGARVNKDPFERLARSIPLNSLIKHKKDKQQIEALLMGQSGLLPTKHKDPQVQHWISEYRFLKSKYQLQALTPESWKFARMRPIAFPTLRISQLADLIYKQEHLFSKCLNASNANEIIELFDVHASEYWDDHYHFNKASENKSKKMGRDAIDVICINAVSPLLFSYGLKTDNQIIKDKAIMLLETIKPEKNKIIRDWGKLNIKPTSSFESQGLLELKLNYCTSFRCLQCYIGNSVMQL